MAQSEPILSTAPVTGIAEPHQSTVAGILRATQQGLFTAAEAQLLIDRVRAQLTALPLTPPLTPPITVPAASPVGLSLSVDDLFPPRSAGTHPTPTLNGPDRTG